MKVIAVMLKLDTGGSATILCEEMNQDPLFERNIVLGKVKALVWPTGSKYINVESWSVPKNTVLNWMIGDLLDDVPVTEDMLTGESQPVPHLPDTRPNEPLFDGVNLQEPAGVGDSPMRDEG